MNSNLADKDINLLEKLMSFESELTLSKRELGLIADLVRIAIKRNDLDNKKFNHYNKEYDLLLNGILKKLENKYCDKTYNLFLENAEY